MDADAYEARLRRSVERRRAAYEVGAFVLVAGLLGAAVAVWAVKVAVVVRVLEVW